MNQAHTSHRRISSPELELVLLCCHWPSSEVAISATLSAQALDWGKVERLLVRHRVTALSWHALATHAAAIPPATRGRIRASALGLAGKSLMMVKETLSLDRHFRAAGIDATFVKGVTLAMLAYGDLAVKESWDIDLLVPHGEVLPAVELLGQLGYVIVEPSDLVMKKVGQFSQYFKELVMHDAGSDTYVELHWRLVDNVKLIDAAQLAGTTAVWMPAGGELPTLSYPALLAYLCLHGTQHGWSRLKWLADIAAFVRRYPADSFEELREAALAHGAARTVDVTLALLALLFGFELPARLAAAIERDRAVRLLVDNALRCINHEDEIERFSPLYFRLFVSRFLIKRGLGYITEEARLRAASLIGRVLVRA